MGSRADIDDLLSGTFNSILRIEERSLDNRLTEGLTITEVHTIVAIGMYEQNPMNVVAARLCVTMATLNAAVRKLVDKGFVRRTRDENDRRKVMVALTKKGRLVYVAEAEAPVQGSLHSVFGDFVFEMDAPDLVFGR